MNDLAYSMRLTFQAAAVAAVVAGGGGPPGPDAAFFSSSAVEASRYYQMHYENAASQGKTPWPSIDL